MRCRTGTAQSSELRKVPDQRCTARAFTSCDWIEVCTCARAAPHPDTLPNCRAPLLIQHAGAAGAEPAHEAMADQRRIAHRLSDAGLIVDLGCKQNRSTF